ncbi:MAG: heavy-metal-associated domain-containing protein [Anaerolineales bacterium]
MDARRRVQLKVVGERTIHCSGCENTVEITLSRIPGLEEIRADHETQLIEFDFGSGEADLDKVKAELEWIGYEVEVL